MSHPSGGPGLLGRSFWRGGATLSEIAESAVPGSPKRPDIHSDSANEISPFEQQHF